MIRLAFVPLALRRKYVIERLLLQNDECDLYLARSREDIEHVVTLRVYQPGLWLEELPFPGLIEQGHAGTGDVLVPWLVQEHAPLGTLGGLMTGEPWHPDRVREVVAAVAACAAEWQSATGRELPDFRADDLLVTAVEPLALAVGHIPPPVRYGWSRPAPPEAIEAGRDAPAMWWALGVLLKDLLNGTAPVTAPEPDDDPDRTGEVRVRTTPAAGAAPTGPVDNVEGRWLPLVTGLLAHDPAERWGAREVAIWLAGGTPVAPISEPPAPLRFADRDHPYPASMALALTGHPGTAEKWITEGGEVLLGNWLDLDVKDERFDREMLPADPPLLITAFAATFTPGARPRYRGFAIDSDGLLELAKGGTPGRLVLTEALESGAVAWAALHACPHRTCFFSDPGGCDLVMRVAAETPVILGQARSVIDEMKSVAGDLTPRQWHEGVGAAVELVLDPSAIKRHRRRLRLTGLSSLRSGGPAWVGWWRDQRALALDGRPRELGTQAAVVTALLLTASATETGRRLADARKEELRRHRDEATDQGRAALSLARERAAVLAAEARLRAPGVLARVVQLLTEGQENLARATKSAGERGRQRVNEARAQRELNRGARR